MVLPAWSTARIVTATGEPAVWGEVMVETAKWWAAFGSTGMGTLVMPRIEPLVWSLALRVWRPTVRSVTVKAR